MHRPKPLDAPTTIVRMELPDLRGRRLRLAPAVSEQYSFENAPAPFAVRPMTNAADIEWLRDLEALRRLGQEYARAVDEHDPDAFDALFDPDGHVDGTSGSFSGTAYVANHRVAPQVFAVSQHFLFDPLIDLEPGADSARLDTYGVAYEMGRLSNPDDNLMAGVRYFDEVLRRDGRWLIHYRKIEVLWTRTF
jgi:hypothetical protein